MKKADSVDYEWRGGALRVALFDKSGQAFAVAVITALEVEEMYEVRLNAADKLKIGKESGDVNHG